MVIRKYIDADCPILAKLFFDTISNVNLGDYTLEQIEAWASGVKKLSELNERFLNSYTLVVEEAGKIVGFGNITSDGYLDMLYVHFDFICQGVGSKILKELEKAFEFKKIVTHSSITAKPFFIKRGFKEVKKQQVERNGILLTNYVLEKEMR